MAIQNLLNNNIHVGIAHKRNNDKQCQMQNRYLIWQLYVLGSCGFDYRINASQLSDRPHRAAEWRQEVTNKKYGPCTRRKGLLQQQQQTCGRNSVGCARARLCVCVSVYM